MNTPVRIVERKFTVRLLEPGIVSVEPVDGIDLDRADAAQMIDAANSIAGGGKYGVLFDATRTGTITAEAREEFKSSKNRIAAAILTNSLANKLISNFFIQFHKPVTPTRIFEDHAAALDWLRKEVNRMN